MTRSVNRWRDNAHVQRYLRRADAIPHRSEGEAVVLELLGQRLERVLDLGTGDGRLLGLLRLAHPQAEGVAVDFSPTMLADARARFAEDAGVVVIEHDLERALPSDWGSFDAVVSSFAIHHLGDDRKRSLYGEVLPLLEPGGVFVNLEHVASPSASLHLAFLAEVGVDPAEEDPSNKLVAVETQLGWLREIGFVDVDCYWKWRELAVLAGRRP